MDLQYNRNYQLVTFITLLCISRGLSRSAKFSTDFGNDAKSTRQTIEALAVVGMTTRQCGARCLNNVQCGGINFRPGNVSACSLVQGITTDGDILGEIGTLFYQKQDADECSSDPCQNNSACVDEFNQYSCTCISGYTGVNCETGIDECASNPCQNSASCVDGFNLYNCICLSGYTDINCETDIDECASDPCQNSASCVDGFNRYSCTCLSGYTDINCETDIDECANSPCQNSAPCIDGLNQYSCTCVSGYTGVNCETDIDECDSNPCQNSAPCVDGLNQYSCTCLSGYTGVNCETDINECSSSPCQNYGTCVDGIGGYTCNCQDDYTGDYCEDADASTTGNPITTAAVGCSAVTIVGRAEWGARVPLPTCCTQLITPLSNAFISHSAGDRCSSPSQCISEVKLIQNMHMDNKNWDDIGYNFIIGEDGRVYEGRGWTNKGAHTAHHNDLGYGINFLGDFMTVAPSQSALDAAQALLQCAVELGNLAGNYVLYGHKDKTQTSSPGDALYYIIRGWPHYP